MALSGIAIDFHYSRYPSGSDREVRSRNSSNDCSPRPPSQRWATPQRPRATAGAVGTDQDRAASRCPMTLETPSCRMETP